MKHNSTAYTQACGPGPAVLPANDPKPRNGCAGDPLVKHPIAAARLSRLPWAVKSTRPFTTILVPNGGFSRKLDDMACNQVRGPNSTVLPADGSKPCEDGVATAQNGARSEGALKIEQSIAFMMQHLDQPLQVAKLAQTAHTSTSHFFVLFKRWAGFSPIDYFIRLRMQRASRLLAATTMSVKEIAAALGYDDPFYFSRLFKLIHGVAPSDYRLMMEQLEQTDTQGGMPGSEKDGDLTPLPVSEQLETNGANQRIIHEKRNILHSVGGNYSVK